MKITRAIDLIIGFLMDVVPVVCAVLIVTKVGFAYSEGYGLFVQKGMDAPGQAHTEMVTITEEDAGSALAVGKILESQKIITSRFTFAVKAKLTGYDGKLLPGTYILSSDMTMEQILEKISVLPGTDSSGKDGGESGQEEDSPENSVPVKENKDVWGQ